MNEKVLVGGDKFVAIVVLNWNGWRNTINCLSSLQSLNYGNKKIIIVDNASSDDSCFQIEKAYPDVTLLRSKENLGFGGGCNIGICYAIAQGADYVWLLNNDTVVEPSTLTTLAIEMEQDLKTAAVGSIMVEMESPTRVQAWGGGFINLYSGRAKHSKFTDNPRDLDYLTAASLLLRVLALEHVGLFNEKTYFMYWEDVDLCFRLKQSGWQLSVAQNTHIRHIESASLRNQKALLHYYFSYSSIQFLKRYSPTPLISITVSITGRALKMLIKGNWSSCLAVVKGAYFSLIQSH